MFQRSAVVVVCLVSCTRSKPERDAAPDPVEPPSLACVEHDQAQPLARFSPKVAPFDCDPRSPPRRRLGAIGPVLAGAMPSGDILVINGLSEPEPRVFAGKRTARELTDLHATTRNFTSDGKTRYLVLGISHAAYGGMIVDIPVEEGLSYSSARVALVPEAELEGKPLATAFQGGDRLVPIADCESWLAKLPKMERWWDTEYLATTDSGEALLLVRLKEFPGRDLEYFAFFGPPDNVAQHKVWNFARPKSGFTTFRFSRDGREGSVMFPAKCDASPVGAFCDGLLTIDGKTVPLRTRLKQYATTVPELEFRCQFEWISPDEG